MRGGEGSWIARIFEPALRNERGPTVGLIGGIPDPTKVRSDHSEASRRGELFSSQCLESSDV